MWKIFKRLCLLLYFGCDLKFKKSVPIRICEFETTLNYIDLPTMKLFKTT